MLNLTHFSAPLSIYFKAFYTIFRGCLDAFHTPFTRLSHAVYTPFTRDSAAVLQLFNTGSTAFQAPFRCTLPTLYGHLNAQRAVDLSVFTRSIKKGSQRGLQCDLVAVLTQLPSAPPRPPKHPKSRPCKYTRGLAQGRPIFQQI